MAIIGKHLKATKALRGITVREMAALAQVDQAQLSTWMNGAPISAANIRKLVDAGLVSYEDGAAALLGDAA